MLTELVHREELAQMIRTARPGRELQPFIESFAEREADFPLHPIRFLPNVAFAIRFNLGGPFTLSHENRSFYRHEHLLIPSHHTWVDDGTFFLIQFRFGLLPLLGITHRNNLDEPVPLSELLCPNFIHDMENAASFEERVANATTYFTRLHEQKRKEVEKYKVVEELIRQFNQSPYDNARIEQSLRNSFISSKSLQRYFLKNFGLTPKSVYCILRVRRALQSYFSNSSGFRLDDFDYYDYSHFYKEIRKVVGVKLPELKERGG